MEAKPQDHWADKRPATEGAYEVFWRNCDSGTGVGYGFNRCLHAHKTAAEAAKCYRRLGSTLPDRPASAEKGVFIGTTHIHAGSPWHEAGEVSGIPLQYEEVQAALAASR